MKLRIGRSTTIHKSFNKLFFYLDRKPDHQGHSEQDMVPQMMMAMEIAKAVRSTKKN